MKLIEEVKSCSSNRIKKMDDKCLKIYLQIMGLRAVGASRFRVTCNTILMDCVDDGAPLVLDERIRMMKRHGVQL